MRSTYKLLMLSTVLACAPVTLALAQAQNNMASPTEPVGAYSSVGQLLTAANQALAAGHSGLAMQQLDQAKVKIINRMRPVTNGPQTYQAVDPVLQRINDARFALTKNDPTMAQQLITDILASNPPELAY